VTSSRTLTPAEAYEDHFGPAIFDPLARLVVPHVPTSGVADALDVACGTGILTRRLAHHLDDGARIVGVDINPGMLDVARRASGVAGTDIDWREGDGRALAFRDATFDVITCQQGLQFFPDRAAGAREFRRLLHPRGLAVIAVWEGLDRHPLYAALAEVEVPHLEAFGVPATLDDLVMPFSLGDPIELRNLLLDAGFSDVEVVQERIVARFPSPDHFIERMEQAYAAVVPAFVEDPAAFASYLDAVECESRDLVSAYRDGDHVAVPMHTNIAIAAP
jgi:SAM-dependent methyltransferase